jgi:hypothetical protein
MRVTLRERDRSWAFAQSVFAGLLVATILQIGATVWWGSRLNTLVEAHALQLVDHEERIREAGVLR